MIRTVQSTLYLSSYRVKPLEYLAIIFGLLGGDDGLVLALGLRYPGETIRAIGVGKTSGRRCLVDQEEISLRGEAGEMAQLWGKRMGLVRE